MSRVKLCELAALLAIFAALALLAVAVAMSARPGELVEEFAACPTCGVETIAVNGEVVCRDERCAAYGLPVRVS